MRRIDIMYMIMQYVVRYEFLGYRNQLFRPLNDKPTTFVLELDR